MSQLLTVTSCSFYIKIMFYVTALLLDDTCYKSRLVFNCCFEDTDISQGSVATLEVWYVGPLVMVLLQIFSWFRPPWLSWARTQKGACLYLELLASNSRRNERRLNVDNSRCTMVIGAVWGDNLWRLTDIIIIIVIGWLRRHRRRFQSEKVASHPVNLHV